MRTSARMIVLLTLIGTVSTEAAPYIELNTKFGTLKQNTLDDDILLNEKPILHAKKTQWGNNSIRIMEPYDLSKTTPKQILRTLAGKNDGCDRNYYIIDLAGDKPYVSEKFGFPNVTPKDYPQSTPENVCLNITDVDWRKNYAIIYTKGFTYKYHYKTHEIEGPLELYQQDK